MLGRCQQFCHTRLAMELRTRLGEVTESTEIGQRCVIGRQSRRLRTNLLLFIKRKEPRQRMHRIACRDETRLRRGVPIAGRMLHLQQRGDAFRHGRIIRIRSCGMKRDQSQGGRGRVTLIRLGCALPCLTAVVGNTR